MKKSRLWKVWLAISVVLLWFWQADRTFDENQAILIRGELGTIATNVLEARGQEFEVRGDFVYLDASDREQTLNNLSAALTSVEFAGGSLGSFFMMPNNEDGRFPVFGESWEPVGYYTHNNVYYEYDPGNPQAYSHGPQKGYVQKRRLDQYQESILQNQRNHDCQALVEAIKKLDPRVVTVSSRVSLERPCLGEISWDTKRPIQRF